MVIQLSTLTVPSNLSSDSVLNRIGPIVGENGIGSLRTPAQSFRLSFVTAYRRLVAAFQTHTRNRQE
jgi:hypothetical protein